MKENTDFKMYFKIEVLFFGICHALEWNSGAGSVSDTRNLTACAKLVTLFLACAFVCMCYTFTLRAVLRPQLQWLSHSSQAECTAELSLPGGLGVDRLSFLCFLVPTVHLKQATEPRGS